VYTVPVVRPVWEKVVSTVVLKTEYEPEPDLYSILYPVIGDAPSLDGAFQKRLIWVEDMAVAATSVGLDGTVAALISDGINTRRSSEKQASEIFRVFSITILMN